MQFSFFGKLEEINRPLAKYGIFVPHHILNEIPKGKWRCKGFINQTPFDLAIQSAKERGKFFLISLKLIKQGKFKLDEDLKIEFNLIDADILELPESLFYILEEDPEGKAKWDEMLISSRRGLVHYINSTKNIDLQIKRAEQIILRCKQGEFN